MPADLIIAAYFSDSDLQNVPNAAGESPTPVACTLDSLSLTSGMARILQLPYLMSE